MTTTCAYMHIATAVVERMSTSISCRMMKRCNGKKYESKPGKWKIAMHFSNIKWMCVCIWWWWMQHTHDICVYAFYILCRCNSNFFMRFKGWFFWKLEGIWSGSLVGWIRKFLDSALGRFWAFYSTIDFLN